MKLAVTFMTSKTIMVECDGMGTDNYPRCFAQKSPAESDIIEMVKKIETENAPELISDWISNGDIECVVSVQKID